MIILLLDFQKKLEDFKWFFFSKLDSLGNYVIPF